MTTPTPSQARSHLAGKHLAAALSVADAVIASEITPEPAVDAAWTARLVLLGALADARLDAPQALYRVRRLLSYLAHDDGNGRPALNVYRDTLAALDGR